jgi:hypothetical protein
LAPRQIKSVQAVAVRQNGFKIETSGKIYMCQVYRVQYFDRFQQELEHALLIRKLIFFCGFALDIAGTG